MSLLSVCDLTILLDGVEAERYQPFMLPADDAYTGEPDLALVPMGDTPLPERSHVIHELPDMKIWAAVSDNKEPCWIIGPKRMMCSIVVDSNYLLVRYLYSDNLSYFGSGLRNTVLSAYFQIVIECKLLKMGYAILHAACIEEHGNAFAFTGPSGVGKSTRASKWVELFDARWISGDCPAIDCSTGTAYGVLWDGKEKIFRNVNRPLAAILKVARSESTYLRPMDDREKMQLLFEQSLLPMWDSSLAARAMLSLKELMCNVPIYELGCDITDESINRAHELLQSVITR